MASATATASERGAVARTARPRNAGGSRLGRLILGLNLLGLAILVIGAIWLNEYRRGLIEARLDSLRLQAGFVANLLDRAATDGDPAPTLDAQRAAELLHDLSLPASERARIFDAGGHLVTDSYVEDDHVEQRQLPPALARGARRAFFPQSTQAQREARMRLRARRGLATEFVRAMAGDGVAGIRWTDMGEQRVSVSVPIRHVKAALGVLTLEAGDVDAIVWAQRRALVPFILIAVGATLASSLLLNTLIAAPIERLARAADGVRLSRARAISLPDLAQRQDEVGGLTRALESMTDAQSARIDAIERFAADVAHELKNPLTSIRSAVETLELAPADHPGRGRLMTVLKTDVRRLDRLITDIANASRLDAELSRDTPRSVDLGRLLADIADLYAARADGAAVRLVGVDGFDPFCVAGREGPLGQVFRNLIDNARSFSSDDGEVRVTLERTGGSGARRVRVLVDDDGPGIPTGDFESIFGRFYTARPKGSAPGGSAFGGHSGLGLSIARQIVEADGGRLTAENRVGGAGQVLGARFVAELPERSR